MKTRIKEIVSMDTKITLTHTLTLAVLVLVFVVIFSIFSVSSITIYAVGSIPDASVYYISQLSPGEEEWGIGITQGNNAYLFYPSLTALLNELIAQHPDAIINFENVSNLDEEVIIDNTENAITSSDINITFEGNLTSIVEGGTHYNEGEPHYNSNLCTYAFSLKSVDKLNLHEFTFNSKTSAFYVYPGSSLFIDSSTITVTALYNNWYSGGAILNDGGILDIKSSAIEWINQGSKGYAIFSYGEVVIDEGVLSNFSLIKGNGAISIADSGSLEMHEGVLEATNESEEGYKTLQVINAQANILGGSLEVSSTSGVSQPVVIKQSTVNFHEGVNVDKSIFIGSGDVSVGSTVTIGTLELKTVPGFYNIELTPYQPTSPIEISSANSDNILLSIVDFNDEKALSNGWGEGYSSNTINLTQAQTIYEALPVGTNFNPDITLLYYVTYRYYNEAGALQNEKITLEEGQSHTISTRKSTYYAPSLTLVNWADRVHTTQSFAPGFVIENISRDYELEENLSLNTFTLVIPSDKTGTLPGEESKLTILPSAYQDPQVVYTFKWYKKSGTNDPFVLIEDNTTSELILHPRFPNGIYKTEVTATLLAPEMGGDGVYSETKTAEISVDFTLQYFVTYFYLDETDVLQNSQIIVEEGQSFTLSFRKSTYFLSSLFLDYWRDKASTSLTYIPGQIIENIDRDYELEEVLRLNTFSINDWVNLSGQLPPGEIKLEVFTSTYEDSEVGFTYMWYKKLTSAEMFTPIEDSNSASLTLNPSSPNGIYQVAITASLSAPEIGGDGIYFETQTAEIIVNYTIETPVVIPEKNELTQAEKNSLAIASISISTATLTFLSILFLAFSKVIIPYLLKRISRH